MAEGVDFFKAAHEELDVMELIIESHLREFILEDPGEFVDPDSEGGPLLWVINGNRMPVFVHAARD
jgi:hypothetical protein